MRDGLTRQERVVLWVLHETQKERGGRNVPTAMLWGRVSEHIDISPDELSALLARLGARAGIVGPAAFTAAWLFSGRRQRDYSIRNEHISGLAAPDARDPFLMVGGFLALGASMVLFARELRQRLSVGGARPGPGPALLAYIGL